MTIHNVSVPPLHIDHYTLRIIQAEDIHSIHSLINDWNVVRMLSQVPFPYPKPLLEQWIDLVSKETETGKSYHFTMIDNTNQKIVGCIGLRVDGKDQIGKIGYWIGHKYWGQQIASKALQRVSTWALANLNINYIRATAADDNLASIAVLKKCGYQPFGQGKEKFLARATEQPVSYFLLQREDICPSQTAASITLSSSTPKKILLVVAAALIDTEGRLLLARRPEGKSMAGMWEFPGGKVEPGETPEAALVRELKEEINVDVSQSCLAPFTFASFEYTDFHLLMPLYVCHKWNNVPEPQENQQLAWVSAEELDHYLVMEADKPFIPLLKDLLF
ncbi:bifunctional GNAT family N-acetyltransferase/(deoxy)nucleoside triphosphate pyrophosphohydrolase [Commensalibacter nepenthis]|uniref:8-oxo-dGTP diphosphatase n=1 Tax=Commensalibacter nepenthis TaxID=3043872 RepID=A0ABT6Q5Y4_9PROT|nr:bifunctional GNAT family N-acetyltransferase/(deoxy)nucleoside triphosphate pyrophosphohydrolase [Commensalibacter sp. TBRC 10068]MDI2112311.1 bifunctional GNAT family N-acetyltransferase/(deoxy)nucleoside triphosphate pyrophosphohydrolase [Commensalibacter sp. TBRC 10068]